MDLRKLIRAASGVAAVGNVSALPTRVDMRVQKAATKLLRNQGLPTDKDRVYDLSILMKRDVAQGGDGYGGDVEYRIAAQRRAHKRTGFPWLWDQKMRDLRNLMSSKKQRTLEDFITGGK